MSAVVFLGPTLPRQEAAAILDATFLPPAAQGDVYRAALGRPRAIGLIDGRFGDVASVWHKEILWAMAQGIHVYGAASMGALRAAELHAFGMVGIGPIFQAFRDGILQDDDEVAVLHGPADSGWLQLTDALVDIRCTLTAAEAADIVDGESCARLLELAKATFYAERTWSRLLHDARTAGIRPACLDALREWLELGRMAQKRADAVELLETMARDLRAGLPPPVVRYRFENTEPWLAFVARAQGRSTTPSWAETHSAPASAPRLR